MLYYTLWFGESQHLFLIFFIFIFFIFCIFIWCNFVQCFFYFWQRISDLGCLIVDAAVYTVEISSEWTGFSFFQVFFLPFPIFGRFLVRSWACAWTNQTFTYHFTFLFSLFIIWKQAGQFPDQPEKNLIHNKCRNPAGDLLDLVKTPQTSTIGQPTPLQAVQSTDRKPPETQAPPDIRQPEAPHSAQWQRSHPVCWRTGETLPLPVLLTGKYRYWSAQFP